MARSGTLLVVGTSALVQPAASLPLLAKRSGAFLIEVNPEATPLSTWVDWPIRGKAGEELPSLWQSLRVQRSAGGPSD